MTAASPSFAHYFPVRDTDTKTITQLYTMSELKQQLAVAQPYEQVFQYLTLWHGLIHSCDQYERQAKVEKKQLCLHMPLEITHGGLVSNQPIFEIAFWTASMMRAMYSLALRELNEAITKHYTVNPGWVASTTVDEHITRPKLYAYNQQCMDLAKAYRHFFSDRWAAVNQNLAGTTKDQQDLLRITGTHDTLAMIRLVGALMQGVAVVDKLGEEVKNADSVKWVQRAGMIIHSLQCIEESVKWWQETEQMTRLNIQSILDVMYIQAYRLIASVYIAEGEQALAHWACLQFTETWRGDDHKQLTAKLAKTPSQHKQNEVPSEVRTRFFAAVKANHTRIPVICGPNVMPIAEFPEFTFVLAPLPV